MWEFRWNWPWIDNNWSQQWVLEDLFYACLYLKNTTLGMTILLTKESGLTMRVKGIQKM